MLKIPDVKEVVSRLPEDFMSKRAENLTLEELACVANMIYELRSR